MVFLVRIIKTTFKQNFSLMPLFTVILLLLTNKASCYIIMFKYNLTPNVLKELVTLVVTYVQSKQPYYCVIPENIHTSPTEGFFSLGPPPPTPLEIPIKLHTFFWPYRTPHPPGNSNPFCRGSMDIF